LPPSTATNFTNAYSNKTPCPAAANAQLKVQILSSDLQFAKMGDYTDTLTITIGAAV